MKSDALKQYIALSKALHAEKAQLEARLHELNQILGASTPVPVATPLQAPISASTGARKRTMSPAGRARIIAAQKARWARYNAGRGVVPATVKVKVKRKMSASAKARIAAAQRARWAAFRAAKG